MSRGIIWQWGVPRTIQGYWDMGRIQIPPLPQNIVFTDRSTGQLWALEHNLTTVPLPDGFGRIGLTDVIPRAPDKIIYGAYDEPYVAAGVQLMVRNGHLGFDYHPDFRITDQSQEGIFIRTTLANSVVKIIFPSAIPVQSFQSTRDTLSWEVLTLP